MKIILWFFLSTLTIFSAHGMSLNEAYQRTKKSAESLARSSVAVTEAKEEVLRRRSIIAPTLELQASELIQDTSGVSSGPPSAVQSTFVRRSRPEVILELRQVLFSGLKDFSALANSKKTVSQRTHEKERLEELLYGDVAGAYYAVLRLQRRISLQTELITVLDERVKELSRFEKLGRSRSSERIGVEANKKSLEAALEAFRGELQQAQNLLLYFIQSDNLPPLDEPNDQNITIPTLEESLLDVSQRKDVVALNDAAQASEHLVTFVKGDYYPTIDFKGHYYPYRVGFQEEIDWDLLFTLTYPIFQGNRTRHELVQSKSQLQGIRLVETETTRKAALEIRNKHSQVAASKARWDVSKEAVELERMNVKLQNKEYRLGLVTNLDVLLSLSQLSNAQQDLEDAKFETHFSLAQLAVARGRIPTETP